MRRDTDKESPSPESQRQACLKEAATLLRDGGTGRIPEQQALGSADQLFEAVFNYYVWTIRVDQNPRAVLRGKYEELLVMRRRQEELAENTKNIRWDVRHLQACVERLLRKCKCRETDDATTCICDRRAFQVQDDDFQMLLKAWQANDGFFQSYFRTMPLRELETEIKKRHCQLNASVGLLLDEAWKHGLRATMLSEALKLTDSNMYPPLWSEMNQPPRFSTRKPRPLKREEIQYETPHKELHKPFSTKIAQRLIYLVDITPKASSTNISGSLYSKVGAWHVSVHGHIIKDNVPDWDWSPPSADSVRNYIKPYRPHHL